MIKADCKMARAKAYIYAEGTPLTSDDLYDVWADACAADDESYDPEPIFEWVLRRHPQFDESWLTKIDRQKANLIAAASDLLAACEAFIFAESMGRDKVIRSDAYLAAYDAAIVAAERAIAKANGE